MTKSFSFALMLAACAAAGGPEPVRSVWILGPAVSSAFANIRPEVHSVEISDSFVTVRSAGISLRYLGALQPPPVPNAGVRGFVFRIPRHPEPETGRHPRIPVDVAGVFVNGLPIYNQFEALSYNGANLWHYDAVAGNDNGTLTAGGYAQPDLTHPTAGGLLERLISAREHHSPLIGFALDGYPVYGPWGYADGELRRMRSSYRLREITKRHSWPDGTELMPEQYGPDVSATAPLGTFAEDYEYVPGSGDLDEFNGRVTVTPEYPQGTYAYFLSTEAGGKLTFPYLIGPRFYGRTDCQSAAGCRSPLQSGVNRAGIGPAVGPAADQGVRPTSVLTQTKAGGIKAIGKPRLTFEADTDCIRAGIAVKLRLTAFDKRGEPIREFEYVHERPIHFVVVSTDLAEFDHIHPALAAGDAYEVSYTFAHGGEYHIWADYSLPGEPPYVDEFSVTVAGEARAPLKLAPTPLSQSAGSLSVELVAPKTMRAGEDIPLTLKMNGAAGTLEPYLGAWAHVIVVSENLRSYSHAHPIESAGITTAAHTHEVSGPAPKEIHITTSFPAPGLYKLWAQFQQTGAVLTVPFVLSVGEAAPAGQAAAVPAGAIRIRITQHGYEPARLEIPANTALTLAFTREAEPNCGSEVVFPALKIRQALPLGQTVLVHLPAQGAGEIAFACGMGMFRGMIVAR